MTPLIFNPEFNSDFVGPSFNNNSYSGTFQQDVLNTPANLNDDIVVTVNAIDGNYQVNVQDNTGLGLDTSVIGEQITNSIEGIQNQQ